MLHAFWFVLGFAPALQAAPSAPETALVRAVEDAQGPVDSRAEVAAEIAKLDELAKRPGDLALEAGAVITRLREEFKRSGPKDQRDIVGALAKLYRTRKPAKEKDAPSDPLHLAVTEALGEMGPHSVPELIGALEDKALRRDLALQREVLLALGRTRDKRAIDPLLENLDNKDDLLVGAAGEALGSFEGADQAVRKKLFEETLKVLISTKGSVDRIDQEQGTAPVPQGNAEGAVLAARYETIRVPLLTTLARLSNHREEEPEAWQRWWNKNKKTSWATEDEKNAKG